MGAFRAPAPRAWALLGAAVAIVLVFPAGSMPHLGGTAVAPAPEAAPVSPALVESSPAWVSLSPTAGPLPPLRTSAAIADDPTDGYAVLFGGCNRHLCPMGDTWKFEGGNWTNLTSLLAVAPSPRQGSVLVDDAADGYLLLFGGRGASGVLNDAWRFSGGTWTAVVSAGPVPPARAFAQATYDSVRGAVVVFGGIAADGSLLADTWEYAAGSWTNLTPELAESPPARANAVLAFSPLLNASVLFGGSGACGTYCGDTWAFSAEGWTNRTGSPSVGPAGRQNATLTFDPGRAGLILFGGYNGVALSDTWGFTGDGWQPLTGNLSSSPGARYSASATWVSESDYVLLFGGVIGGSRLTTWALLSPLAATVIGPDGPVVPGAAVSFQGTIAGGLAPYNSTWQFGDGTAPALGLTASHTFASPGTYVVQFLVEDGAGEVATANASVWVRLTPLNVTISPSASTGSVGASLFFTALVAGGAPPYAYAWSAPAGVCSGGKSASLDCAPASEGTLQVSVTVSDASGRSVSAGLAVPIAAAPGGGSAISPTPTPAGPALGSSWGSLVVLLPIVLALSVALGVGVLMFLAARRRARALLAQRPHCYAVPAWSETPPEFTSPAPAEDAPPK